MFFQHFIEYKLYIWGGIIAILIFYNLTGPTQYGRHIGKSIILKNTSFPRIHPYFAWTFMELPMLISIITVSIYFWESIDSWKSVICIVIFGSHYFYRSFIYTYMIRKTASRTPLDIMIYGFSFNILIGCMTTYGFITDTLMVPFKNLEMAQMILGIALILIGFIIHTYHDNILIHLKSKEGEYRIPHGGLFQYVSCPNYLGEIIEWTGMLLFSGSITFFLYYIYTFINVTWRPFHHHKWYKEKFTDYPAERKALIPFIY